MVGKAHPTNCITVGRVLPRFMHGQDARVTGSAMAAGAAKQGRDAGGTPVIRGTQLGKDGLGGYPLGRTSREGDDMGRLLVGCVALLLLIPMALAEDGPGKME